MSFRYRPRSLLLRRTSSCSSIQLTGLMSGGGRHKFASKDWTCNDGAPPTGGLLNVPEEGVVPNENNNRRPPPPIILEPSREGAVEHISVIENPDPPCHFCREQTSKPVHENCTRLKIVSRGRWRTHTSRLITISCSFYCFQWDQVQVAIFFVSCMGFPRRWFFLARNGDGGK